MIVKSDDDDDDDDGVEDDETRRGQLTFNLTLRVRMPEEDGKIWKMEEKER